MTELPKIPNLPSGTQMINVFRVSDGECFVRWPIDAREMLKSGDYTLEDPSGAQPVEAEPEAKDPVPHVAEAKEKVEAEHSPGAPLNATDGEPAAPLKEPEAKKAPPTRKSRKNTPKGDK